jgi:hypothetical protein
MPAPEKDVRVGEPTTTEYQVEITRTVRTTVTIKSTTPGAAVEIVDTTSYELPPPDAWSVDKGSYDYVVCDANGEVLDT